MVNRVLVAFSGGIDSTYAIISLINAGYHVEALHFIHGQVDSIDRCKKITNLLKINLHIVDVSTMFEQVFSHIKNELKNVRIPNPCVYCNKIIKFDFIIKYALDNGFNYCATGHYARCHELSNGKKTIMCALDETKDQSYFLNQINPEMLNYVLFPLGNIRKNEIYNYMKQHNIELPQHGESYDLCFTGGKKFIDFCACKFDVDIEGIVTQDNVQLCKVRHAELLNINNKFHYNGKKFYVIDKHKIDDKTCEIVINKQMNVNITVFNVNNINIFVEQQFEKLMFVVKYHAKPISGHFDYSNNIIYLDEPTFNPGIGQYIVAYHNNIMIFGCMIKS